MEINSKFESSSIENTSLANGTMQDYQIYASHLHNSYADYFSANNVTIDGGVIRNVTFDGLAISELREGLLIDSDIQDTTANNLTANNSTLNTGKMHDYEIFVSTIKNSEMFDSFANNFTANSSTINNSSIYDSEIFDTILDCGTF